MSENEKFFLTPLKVTPDPLRRSFVIDLLSEMESHCISCREAIWRNDDHLGVIHFDSIRLIGREIAKTLSEMQKG